MRCIVRVDDVGQAVKQDDRDDMLRGFSEWYHCWKGTPLYCAAVPGSMEKAEIRRLYDMVPKEFVAVHGWSHAREPLTRSQIARCLDALDSPSVVVPPYNLYNRSTLQACAELIKGPVLLGGFDGADHPYGREPCYAEGVLHVSADGRLYDKSGDLADALELNVPTADYPLLVVLHWRWDVGAKQSPERLARLLRPWMVTVEDAREHADRRGGAGKGRQGLPGEGGAVPRSAGPRTSSSS